MTNVIKLSDTKFNTSEATVLKYLLDNNKPVFVEVPANMNVWGIDRKLERLSEEEAFANEFQKTHLNIEQRDFVNNNEISATHLMQAVSFIRLSSDDLTILIKNSRHSITESNAIVYFDSEGDIKEQNFIDGRSYFSTRNNPENKGYSSFVEAARDLGMRSPITIPKRWNNIKFVFTRHGINKSREFNSPLNDLENLRVERVERGDVYVFEADIKDFLTRILDLMPNDSPYYIPKELRGLSDLDELAEIGYKAYKTSPDGKVKSKKLALLIREKLDYKPDPAESAAFFLNPNPSPKSKKGNDSDINTSTKCQFPYLIKVLEDCWVIKLQEIDTLKALMENTEKKKIKRADKTKKIKGYLKDIDTIEKFTISEVVGLLGELGFSDDNAKYGELILRPKTLGEFEL